MPEPVINALVLFFVWLFAVAAWHKLSAAGYYQELVQAYLGPAAPARILTVLVALLELAVVSLLLYQPVRHWGLGLVAALLLGYGALMAWQLWRTPEGARMKCGCAGPGSESRVSFALVLRNLCCALLAMIAVSPAEPAMPGLQAWLLSAFVGIFLVVIYLCAEQLISNAQLMNEGRS